MTKSRANLNFKKNLALLLALIIFCILQTSCEKDITVSLPKVAKMLVVEGAIEQGQYAYLTLTRNASYFDPVDQSTIYSMIVIDAIVTVSDGSMVDTLKFKFIGNRYPYFEYIGSTIIGEPNKTYTLKIVYHDTTLTATTTIPIPVKLDTLAFVPRPYVDTVGYIMYYFTDPPALGNCYRIFSKVIGKDSIFAHPSTSVMDDKLFNGKQFEYPLYHGIAVTNIQTDTVQTQFRRYFHIGDKVVVKFCSIDRANYLFWQSIEQQESTGGNPFASPSPTKTNIVGHGLGVWGGYGECLDTIIIKPQQTR